MVATLEVVKAWLKLTTTTDDDLVRQCTAAANTVVGRYATPPTDDLERADHDLAATMLAARLYRRRNSPEGVQAMTDAGAWYVARTDPDIARLLRIDQYITPQVG